MIVHAAKEYCRGESEYPGLGVRSTWTQSPEHPHSQFYVLGLSPVIITSNRNNPHSNNKGTPGDAFIWNIERNDIT